jgi:hypothetical protein
MNLAVYRYSVDLHSGGALYVGDRTASGDVVIEFVGGNYLEIVGGQMLPNHREIPSGWGEPGLVLIESEPAMVVGRISVVHPADQIVEFGFVVLVEPERNGDLTGLIFGAKDSSIR